MDVGETTRDHITLGTPHPAEHGIPTSDHETALHRYSRRALLTGLTILTGTYLGTLTISVLTAHGHLTNIDTPTSRLFSTLALISLHTLGASLTLIAGLERITRPMRTLTRHTAVAVADLTETVERTRAVVGDVIYSNHRVGKQITGLAGQLDDVNARLDSLDIAMARVPTYADGFKNGARVTATALGFEPRD